MKKMNGKPSPDELEALLPWHATGTLNSRDAAEVEEALAQDKELARRFALVREEMTETILLNEALGAPSARAMEKLFKAIDQERKSARAPATKGIGAWLAELFTPRVLAFSAAAGALVILLQAGVITKMVLEDQSEGAFETASAPSDTRGIDVGSYALVRFSPQANMADVTRFLDARGALIVDGPRPGGAGGMYRVRIVRTRLAPEALDRAVKEFQSASTLVTFAAATQ
jgi:anti-sigma factor RsiW